MTWWSDCVVGWQDRLLTAVLVLLLWVAVVVVMILLFGGPDQRDRAGVETTGVSTRRAMDRRRRFRSAPHLAGSDRCVDIERCAQNTERHD